MRISPQLKNATTVIVHDLPRLRNRAEINPTNEFRVQILGRFGRRSVPDQVRLDHLSDFRLLAASRKQNSLFRIISRRSLDLLLDFPMWKTLNLPVCCKNRQVLRARARAMCEDRRRRLSSRRLSARFIPSPRSLGSPRPARSICLPRAPRLPAPRRSAVGAATLYVARKTSGRC